MAEPVALYGDGGVVGANPSPRGGTWAFVLVDAQGRVVARQTGLYRACGAPACDQEDHWPQAQVTNNHMEFAALVRGLEALPPGWAGTVYSDSTIALRRLFAGARLGNVPPAWIRRGSEALARLGPVRWVPLDGHPTRAHLAAGVGPQGRPVSAFQVWCDQACTAVAREARHRYGLLRTWGCPTAAERGG